MYEVPALRLPPIQRSPTGVGTFRPREELLLPRGMLGPSASSSSSVAAAALLWAKDDIFGGCNHALAMRQTSASGTTSSLGLDLLSKRAQKLLGIEMVGLGLEMVRFGFFGISIGSLYMIDACINRPLSATDCDATSRSIHPFTDSYMSCHATTQPRNPSNPTFHLHHPSPAASAR
jgi:hypothetical protein